MECGVAQDMALVLTDGGVDVVFSTTDGVDCVPVILQVLDVSQSSASQMRPPHVEVTLSDGIHFFTIILAMRLNVLFKEGALSDGCVVRLSKYIIQPLVSDKIGVIALEMSVIGPQQEIVGVPEQYVPKPSSDCHVLAFVGNNIDGVCSGCSQENCDWNVYGPHIVKSITESNSCHLNVENSLRNKACRHAAYTMFSRSKFGYLGKGNRVPLPSCVVKGIRDNFPDPNDTYVGFASLEDK
jgi:hypothetical protein